MDRRGLLASGLLVATVAVLAVGSFVWFRWQGGEEPVRGGPASGADLGIVYVPLTASTARYYDVAVENGALITEVTNGSLAERAGVQAGDVILTFNGLPLQGGVSLAALLIDCTSGPQPTPHEVDVSVWRGGCVHSVQIVHSAAGYQ